MKPGIYLGLDDDDYFAAQALGSTDFKKLAQSPADWWAGSFLNPAATDPDLHAQEKNTRALGSAIHTLVMEGQAAFHARFVIENWKAAPKASDIHAMRMALMAKGIETPVTLLAREAAAICRQHGVRTQEEAKDRYEAGIRMGREPLTQAQAVRAFAVDTHMRAVEDLSLLADGGLTEIAVFWERDGVLLRAKFDKLLPALNLDMKTITPRDGVPFKTACMRNVADYRYDIQAVLYAEARRIAATFTARQISGGTAADRKLLKKMLAVPESPTGMPDAGWCPAWLFIQPPQDERGRGRAFKALPVFPAASPDWPTVSARAAADIDRGIAAFAGGLDRHGRAGPWREVYDGFVPQSGDFGRVLTGEFDD